MHRIKIKKILSNPTDRLGNTLKIAGWVRSMRKQKAFAFIDLNDGSTITPLQSIIEENIADFEQLCEQIKVGTALSITGVLVESPGQNQSVELNVQEIQIIGTCPAEEYPLQKKRHSFEFLRGIAHLRPRTNTGGAVARLRSKIAGATHAFFQKKDFIYLQSPIITGSDCEGAGDLFQVTTLDLKRLASSEEKPLDYTRDFFKSPTYLTVSGQLNAEAYALALSDVYTFGPTFRAENSHTSRHLAEFWMIEPEIAFANLTDVENLSEEYLKYIIEFALNHCADDIDFFDRFIEKGLKSRLENVLSSPFNRFTYTEAITILQKANKTFVYPVQWGMDLQSEHERYLAEEHCRGPIILTDYPRDLKAFYMRDNPDGKTVAAMDVIVPSVGEIIGGSQREERLEILQKKFEKNHLDSEKYRWYLDLRKFGSAPHGGFGVGFERLVQFLSGMENIRDISPFPRVPGHAEF